MKGNRFSAEQIIAVLKRLVADSLLDNAALKDLLGKNVSSLRRAAVIRVMERHWLSQVRACELVGLDRTGADDWTTRR